MKVVRMILNGEGGETGQLWHCTLPLPTFVHLGSRKVYVAGVTPQPDQAWMVQMAWNVTMVDWGFLTCPTCSTTVTASFAQPFNGRWRRLG